MRTAGYAGAALACLGMLYGAERFVTYQNTLYAARQAVEQAHADDVSMCRMQLGIDYNIGQRRLAMACAQEVVAKPQTHERRHDAAERAWNTCMPEMGTCDRALQ